MLGDSMVFVLRSKRCLLVQNVYSKSVYKTSSNSVCLTLSLSVFVYVHFGLYSLCVRTFILYSIQMQLWADWDLLVNANQAQITLSVTRHPLYNIISYIFDVVYRTQWNISYCASMSSFNYSSVLISPAIVLCN